jgi:hypothetical protein
MERTAIGRPATKTSARANAAVLRAQPIGVL